MTGAPRTGKGKGYHGIYRLICTCHYTVCGAVPFGPQQHTSFAQTHPEVRALAVVSTGREVLQLLQNGLNPQVIVLDMQLRDPGIQTLICGIRAMQLVPKPRLLLSAPTPEQTSGEDALLTFRGQEVILRPYEMRTLFERVYLLGAGDEAAQLYRVRNHCRRILRDMQANPVLSGCTYLERMILLPGRMNGICPSASCTRWPPRTSQWTSVPSQQPSVGSPVRCKSRAHRCISSFVCALACRRTLYCPTANC